MPFTKCFKAKQHHIHSKSQLLMAEPQLAPNAANDISGAIGRDKMSPRKVETVEAARAERTEEQLCHKQWGGR